MKTPKDEDTIDLTGPASKKMKQARLPFKLLTPKVADTKSNEEIADKDETQKEKSCEDGMTDKKAKENAKTDDVIVLEDSVEFTDEFKDKSEPEKVPVRSSTRKRSISDSPPKKVAAKKRQKTSKNDATPENKSTREQESKSTLEKEDKTRNLRNDSLKEAKDLEDEEEEGDVSKLPDDSKSTPSKSSDKTQKLKRESPKKKMVKGSASSSKDGDLKSETTKSPTKTQNLRKESLRKKATKEEEDKVEEDNDVDDLKKPTTAESANKRQSLRKQSPMKKFLKKNENDESKQDDSRKSTSPKESQNSANESPEKKLENERKDGELTPKNGGSSLQDGGSPPQDGGSIAATPASVSKTPKSRKLTPGQLEKQKESAKKKAEKEQMQLEKERLKKEKEDQLNRLKEERLKMKLDKEEQKKKEREEKEELRKKEKEEKEKKRLAEIELKNEAKRLKEEEKKKQNEAKDEEKRAREEEKLRKEAEKRKAAEAFASFFKPKETTNAAGSEADVEMEVDSVNKMAAEENFMPFEVKCDMRLSNVCRRTLGPATKSMLDEKLLSQDVLVNDLYINLLKSKRHSPLTGEKTWPIVDESDDECMIIEAEVNEENACENTDKEVHKERKAKCYKAKLLQFEENRRPPYWGTWRKKSASIGARRPFCLDKSIFEYEVDSDDEWEEEEPGESLRGSDDENEKESEDEYEVDNKVFVPHGYLSDEEMQEDFEDCSREAQKAKLQLLEIEFQAEMNRKTEKLKPRLIGCVWFENSVSNPSTVGSRIAEMLLSRRMVLFGSDVALPIEAHHRQSSMESSSASSPAASSPLVEQSGRKLGKFPESAIPMLIKLVHGNQNKLSFLVREFSSYLTKNCTSTLDVPSMTAIRHKIRHLAKWMPFLAEDSSTCPLAGKMCWYVGKDVREKHELLLNDSELVTDPWIYILQAPRKSVLPIVIDQPITEQSPKSASITKFTKKLTEEERKKQLLPVSADSSPTSTATIKKTSFCKPSNLLATFVSSKSNNSNPTKSCQQNNDDDDDDVIFISPDITEQDKKESGEKGNHSTVSVPNKSLPVEASGTKTPVVKKRVQLTTLCTFGMNSVVKKSEPVVKKTEPVVKKSETVVKKSEPVDKTTIQDKNIQEHEVGKCAVIVPDSKTEESPRTDLNVSKSPEAFLGFCVADIQKTPTSKASSRDPSKTPKSEPSGSRGKRTSIESFFTKGSSGTSVKKQTKLFDRKQATDKCEGSSKEDGDSIKASSKVKNSSSEESPDAPSVQQNMFPVLPEDSKTTAGDSTAIVSSELSSVDQNTSKTSSNPSEMATSTESSTLDDLKTAAGDSKASSENVVSSETSKPSSNASEIATSAESSTLDDLKTTAGDSKASSNVISSETSKTSSTPSEMAASAESSTLDDLKTTAGDSKASSADVVSSETSKTSSNTSEIATSAESSKPVEGENHVNKTVAVVASSKLLEDINEDVDMDTSQNESNQESKVRSASSSPSQTPAKKRVKLTSLSPPKWRVKLSKPQIPAEISNEDDDNDDGVIVIE